MTVWEEYDIAINTGRRFNLINRFHNKQSHFICFDPASTQKGIKTESTLIQDTRVSVDSTFMSSGNIPTFIFSGCVMPHTKNIIHTLSYQCARIDKESQVSITLTFSNGQWKVECVVRKCVQTWWFMYTCGGRVYILCIRMRTGCKHASVQIKTSILNQQRCNHWCGMPHICTHTCHKAVYFWTVMVRTEQNISLFQTSILGHSHGEVVRKVTGMIDLLCALKESNGPIAQIFSL